LQKHTTQCTNSIIKLQIACKFISQSNLQESIQHIISPGSVKENLNRAHLPHFLCHGLAKFGNR